MVSKDPGGDWSELRTSLESNGFAISDLEIPPEAPATSTAIYAVTGIDVQPAATILRSASNVDEEIDRRWEMFSASSLYSSDEEFLVRPSSPGSNERGWIRVKDTVGNRVPTRIKSATGCREYIAVSIDGRYLRAISVEDDEYWIVEHHFS